MKKSLLYILCGLLFMPSCRDLGDNLLSYGYNDSQAFGLADNSYAAQFEGFWTAMNENYCIWDFEEKMGLNWDEVYATYMPQFEALDDTSRHIKLSDAEFTALYSQFLDSLHDGHSIFTLKNIATGNFVTISPCRDRNLRERGERYNAENQNPTNLNAYLATDIDLPYRILDHKSANAKTIVINEIDSSAHRLLRATTKYLEAVDNAGGPTELNDEIYTAAGKLHSNAQLILSILNQPIYLVNQQLSQLCSMYNELCAIYKHVALQVGVTLTPLDLSLCNDRLGFINYALFPDNIAYLRIGAFGMSDHLDPDVVISDTTTVFYTYHKAVQQVWRAWFDAIQTHYAAGDLGGVIIDVRNNTGGIVNDYQYLLGALLPSGGWESHTLRVKNGCGRLDFAPLTPFVMGTYPEPHAVITEQPIVVLANSNSCSLSENTTWGVISQPNGYFIGTRTYGALSALTDDSRYYSCNYSGTFGQEFVTSFYGLVPMFVCLYGEDLHIAEGVGFTPHEDLPLDVQLWTTQGRDNQLERAIDYIQHK